MITTHRTLRGAWTRCIKPEACQLLFHFPGMTPAQMKAMPLEMLLPVLETFQPPDAIDGHGGKTWFERDSLFPMGLRLHRDYDLPAVVGVGMTREWWSHGKRHRGHGLPAALNRDGSQYWSVRGVLHRPDNLPAVVYGDGSTEYWQRGMRHRTDGPAIDWRPAGGGREWYVNGHALEQDEFLLQAQTQSAAPC